MNWREDQGVEGRICILRIIKEEWKNVKPSVLRYHRELRRELGEGWNQSLRTELEPAVQRLFGEDWKEVAEKYLYKLEEEERKMCHNATKERGEEERDQEGEDKKEEERKPEVKAKEEEKRDQEDDAREKEEEKRRKFITQEVNMNEEEEKNQEDETRKKRVGWDDTRKTNSKREEDECKKKEVRESIMLCNLESLGLTNPTESEIRENSVWLRLVRMNKLRGEDGEDGRSSWANLENMKSQTLYEIG